MYPPAIQGLGWCLVLVSIFCFMDSQDTAPTSTKHLTQQELQRRDELLNEFWPYPDEAASTDSNYNAKEALDAYDQQRSQVIGRAISEWREFFSLAHTVEQESGTTTYVFWMGEVEWSTYYWFQVRDGLIVDASCGTVSK